MSASGGRNRDVTLAAADGNGMYVTCGIGFSLLPTRINAPLLIDLSAG